MSVDANPYEAVFAEFNAYRECRQRFVDSMRSHGIATGNMDPIVDFAEVVVAREFDGKLQQRANKDVDVMSQAGLRIQVKSLRVSGDRPSDNWLSWSGCTRRRVAVSDESPLI